MEALDRAIMMNRETPLSKAELAAFVRAEERPRFTVLPYLSVKEIKVGGKKKIVPFVGIQGTF